MGPLTLGASLQALLFLGVPLLAGVFAIRGSDGVHHVLAAVPLLYALRLVRYLLATLQLDTVQDPIRPLAVLALMGLFVLLSGSVWRRSRNGILSVACIASACAPVRAFFHVGTTEPGFPQAMDTLSLGLTALSAWILFQKRYRLGHLD